MNWTGVIPALTTAFQPDYTVDHAFVAKHARWLVENGCTGVVALGSLGESATLAFDEKVAILKTLVAALVGRPVVAGYIACNACSTGSQSKVRSSRSRNSLVGVAIIRLSSNPICALVVVCMSL